MAVVLLGPLRERDEPRQMLPAELVLLPGRAEALQRMLTNRLQHPVPLVPLLVLGLNKRPVQQPPEQVQDALGGQRLAGADPLGRLQGEASDEHPELPVQDGLLVVQQVVAPVDQRTKGPGAGTEQAEPVVEPLVDLPRGEKADPGRRELDGQRWRPMPRILPTADPARERAALLRH
jgi:hypothetical protein